MALLLVDPLGCACSLPLSARRAEGPVSGRRWRRGRSRSASLCVWKLIVAASDHNLQIVALGQRDGRRRQVDHGRLLVFQDEDAIAARIQPSDIRLKQFRFPDALAANAAAVPFRICSVMRRPVEFVVGHVQFDARTPVPRGQRARRGGSCAGTGKVSGDWRRTAGGARGARSWLSPFADHVKTRSAPLIRTFR